MKELIPDVFAEAMERDRQDTVLQALYKQKSDLIEKASVRWIDHNYNLVFDSKTEQMLEHLNKQIFEHHIERLKDNLAMKDEKEGFLRTLAKSYDMDYKNVKYLYDRYPNEIYDKLEEYIKERARG